MLDFQSFKLALGQLSPQTQPLWGKMNAAQVLAHLSIGFEMALNPHKPKQKLLWKFLGPFLRKKLLSPSAFPKNSPTAPWFIVADTREFDLEMQKLLLLIDRFEKEMPQCPALIHPNFGPMSLRDWQLLQWKHLDHHLRQFGLIK